MNSWISKWVMFVSAGHTAVAVMFFGSTYGEIVQNGVYNAVKSEKTGLAVWFLFFGFLLFVFGMLLAVIEKNETSQIPNSIGMALLILTTLGVILMPVSGFWLLFPAAFALLYKKTKTVS